MPNGAPSTTIRPIACAESRTLPERCLTLAFQRHATSRRCANMPTADTTTALTQLFSELVNGANTPGGAFILNSGDVGLLRSLDKLSAADASRSVNDGASIAAHAQHLRYGLSLMNAWAREGGNPFANARWDEAWHTSVVDATQWEEIRTGLRAEVARWLAAMGSPRQMTTAELSGMIGSVAHLAYHLGAVRQIEKSARGPKEGTFA
jgi:hypothetical protein